MNPYYEDESVRLFHGDCLDVLRELPDNSVDSVCTDPPYGLEFMGKAWDAIGNIGKAKNRGMGGIASKGMTLPESYNADANVKCELCSRWKKDHAERKCTCAAPQFPNVKAQQARVMQEWHLAWVTECLRILKPGGHMLAFGGSRTWHRLTCAVEDAGFEIRDSIAWLYGSGFPKSLDVSKAIDRVAPRIGMFAAFAAHLRERRVHLGLTQKEIAAHFPSKTGGITGCVWNWENGATVPTPEQWPRLADILQIPHEMWSDLIQRAETERSVIGRRTDGAANGSVVGLGSSRSMATEYDATAPATEAAQQWQGWGTALKPAFEPIVVGRKPLAGTVAANVQEHGTGALNIDGCRTGVGSPVPGGGGGEHSARSAGILGESVPGNLSEPHTSGRWPTNVVLDESQAAELDQQTGILKSGYMKPETDRETRQGDAYGQFAARTATETYGDSGGASRFFPVFRYEAKAPTSERPRAGEVAHPTVKPLDLMRWLVRLVTPPGGTVLEPFAGSGTTAEACVIEGFQCIAIEREAEYLPLIVARLSKPIQMGLDFEGGAA